MKLTLAFLAAAVLAGFASLPARASSFSGVGSGDSYAAYVTLEGPGGITVVSGPIALARLTCKTDDGTDANSVLLLRVPPYVLSSGTAHDTVTSSRGPTSAAMQSISTIEGVGVLGGLVKATTVKAEATSTGTGIGASSSAAGSELVGLSVAGVAISGTPNPNTKMSLAGLGYVILNQQTFSGSGSTTQLIVNMIHVVVTQPNSLHLPIGTNIVVGHAKSAFTDTLAPVLTSANSYALLANGFAGNIHATSGPWANADTGCPAGFNENRLVSASTPVGTLGTMDDTASGTIGTPDVAEGKSRITKVNVLSGLITADVIIAEAKVTLMGSVFKRTVDTTFVNLNVAGVAIGASPPPNTQINLAGLGYVILNQRSGYTTSKFAVEEVNGLEVVVTQNNSYGLPIGATITVAHGRARVSTY